MSQKNLRPLNKAELAFIHSLVKAESITKLKLVRLGISSKVIHKLVKHGILDLQKDPYTGIVTYRVSDEFREV